MKKLATVFLAFALAGCGTFDFLTTPVNQAYPELPQSVTGLKATLTLVKSGWAVYVERPVCGSPKAVAAPKKPCSDWAIIEKGHNADLVSRQAVSFAEQNESSSAVSALVNSVGAFRSIVNVVSPTPVPTVQ